MALAGTRQRNILQSLLENMGDLKNLQDQVANSAGSAEKKFNEAYGQSLDAKINDLKHSLETLYDSMMNSDSFKKVLDGITKMFNGLSQSEDLKWVANEIANIITLLASMDGTTIKTVASIAISLKMLKTAFNFTKEISALNAGLTALADASVIKGGFKQFIAVLMGMASTTKTVTTGVVVETVAVTGLSGAFTLLTTSLKSALSASIAFMNSPIGIVVTAIAVVIGVATYAISKHKEKQQELKQKTDELAESYKNLKQVIEDFNNGKVDGGSVSNALKPYEDYLAKQKEQKQLLQEEEEIRKKVNDLRNKDTNGGMSQNVKEQESLIKKGKELEAQLQKVNQELEAQKQALKDAGITDYEIQQAQLIDVNTKNAEAIKKSAEVEYQHKESIIALIQEYQTLNSAENKNTVQKQRMSQIAQLLQGDIQGLVVVRDSEGNAIIKNTNLLNSEIQILQQDGATVKTLANIKLAAAKDNAAIQVGETTVLYKNSLARIDLIKQEINAYVAKERAAKAAAAAALGVDEEFLNGMGGESVMTSRAQAEIAAIESARAQLDAIYSSSDKSGISSPSNLDGVSFTPSGSGSGSDTKKDPNDPSNVQNLELKIDRYQNLNAAIDNVNNALTKNKTLQDQANDKDKLSLLNQEITLLNQKRTALNNLLAEQQREKGELETQIRNAGFLVDSTTGLISNFQSRLQALQNSANAQTTKTAKQSAIDNVKKVEEAIKTYMDLVHKTMATTKNDILSISGEIKKVYEEELSAISDVESKITDVIKKQVEERKKAIEDEKNAKIKAIEEAQDAYNKDNSEDDYQENLSNEQQKLSEIQSQIADASRDQSIQGKARLKSLMDEAKAQQDVIDKMVLDHQRELNNQAFDDQKQAIEDDAETKTKSLDDTYTDQKVSQIVKQALSTGYFTDINGKMTSIKDAYIDFENRFGEGMSALGNKIKSDFISQLDEARQVMTSLSSIMNNLGISNINDVNSGIFTNASNLLSNVNLNLPQITPNITIPTPNVSGALANNTPQIVFNQPFITIQGNVDDSTMPKLQSAISDAIEKFKQSITSQLQLQGIY